ncbi:unnamed protein product [Rotaria sordida]|uniref:Uncharacterized protein n=1 Tax=Rotaria sordida TaxID=392033 RepID=A0A819URL3_9BILA|nr:unnamed protein product [Rotaria sordida]
MFKLSQLNTNGLLMEKIYMIGGVDEPDYERFHDTLNQMKQNHSLLTPMFNDLTINDLRNFINLIEYSNLKINLLGGDLDAKRCTAFISDITVIIDRKTTSNCFFSMSIINVRRFYDSCINETGIELEAVNVILSFVNNELGGWPILQGSSWNDASYNLTRLLIKLREYSHNTIFGFSTSADDKNSSVNFIRVYQSSIPLEQRSNYLNETKITKTYRQFIYDVASALTNNIVINVNEVDDIYNFEKRISTFHWTPAEKRARRNETIRTTIGNLSQIFNTSFDFTNYLRHVYFLSNVSLNDNDIVSISEIEFLRNVSSNIDTTLPCILQNYIVWCFIMNRISNMPKRYRALRDPFNEAFRGTIAQRPRSITCGDYINNNMGFALSKIYFKQYFDENARNQSLEMINNIRTVFLGMLKNSTWMDETSKNKSIEKALVIDEKIGYPDFLGSSNTTKLEKMYQDDSYIHHVFKLLQIKSNENFRMLREPVDRKAWGASPPTVVNAFYNPSRNQIIFPAGIFQMPFFNKDAPKISNKIRAIGMVIGHEITHGFDDTGRQFDKDGNRISWWTPETIERFNLNGFQTQGENIADNGGLKESFYAYQNWARTHPNMDKKLPGLSNYSAEQMFFINYAQIWCSKMTDANALNRILTGFHSPGEFRMRGPMSNFDEFDRVFKCTPGQGNSQIIETHAILDYSEVLSNDSLLKSLSILSFQ